MAARSELLGGVGEALLLGGVGRLRSLLIELFQDAVVEFGGGLLGEGDGGDLVGADRRRRRSG